MLHSVFQDIIEFVDAGSSGFLSDLCLVVASYNDMFINRPHLQDAQQWYVYILCVFFHKKKKERKGNKTKFCDLSP
jgi:hypothetical protein